VVIMVCDQPCVTGDHLLNLVKEQQASGMAIISSQYGNTRGVPALFHRSLFGELLKLQGDRGARRIIEAHAERAGQVALPEGAVDIDTPEAYRALMEARGGAPGPEPEKKGE